MKINGKTIYDTKASPLAPLNWGRCTKKESKNGTTLYISVFNWPKRGRLIIPGLKNEVISTSLLMNKESLNFEKYPRTTPDKNGLIINVPFDAPDPLATVIKVELKGTL